jgi:hypothetical protein
VVAAPAAWSGINSQNIIFLAWVDSADTVFLRICNASNVAKTMPNTTPLSITGRVLKF